VRSISVVAYGEYYDEYDRRVVRGHSAFQLTPREQAMTGMPEYVGFGVANPHERWKLAPHRVTVRYSRHANVPDDKRVEVTNTRVYTGRPPTLEPQDHLQGTRVDLGDLEQAGADRFKEAVGGFDWRYLDVTGVRKPNCAAFVREMCIALEARMEEEHGCHDTSHSVMIKAQRAMEEERSSPEKNPLARTLRALPPPEAPGAISAE